MLLENKTLARWVRLALVCAIFFIDIANLGMANIALPSIKQDLDFDEGSLQWILTAYSLTYGSFLMVGGRLGDVFAQYVVMNLGMTLFNASTLVCALVSDRIGLVIGRAFQGLGAGLTIPSAQACVSILFEDAVSRVIAFAIWGATGSTGFVLGPIFGGLFSSLASWRWIFWLSLIVEGALQIASFFLLRNLKAINTGNKQKDKPLAELIRQFDPLGICLSVPGLVLLVHALTTGNEQGWRAGGVITTLVLAVALLCVFVWVQLKVSTYPLILHYLWSDKSKWSGCAIASLTYAVWQGLNYILTLELQDFGFSALQTAVRFLPLGITALIVNSIIPSLLKPVGTSALFVVSWLLAIAGVVLLALMGSKEDYWRFCSPGMILYIAGVGTAYYVGNILVVASAPAGDQGSISGVYNMCLNIGGAVLGVAMLTLVSDSVTMHNGGEGSAQAVLDGYRAGYYLALGFCGLAMVLSLMTIWFSRPAANGTGEATTDLAIMAPIEDKEKITPDSAVAASARCTCTVV